MEATANCVQCQAERDVYQIQCGHLFCCACLLELQHQCPTCGALTCSFTEEELPEKFRTKEEGERTLTICCCPPDIDPDYFRDCFLIQFYALMKSGFQSLIGIHIENQAQAINPRVLQDVQDSLPGADLYEADKLFENKVLTLSFRTSKARDDAASFLEGSLYRSSTEAQQHLEEESIYNIFELKQISSLSLPALKEEEFSQVDLRIIEETKRLYCQFDFIMLQCGVPLGRDPNRDFIRLNYDEEISLRDALRFEDQLKDFKLNRGFSSDLAIRLYNSGKKAFMIIYLGRYGQNYTGARSKLVEILLKEKMDLSRLSKDGEQIRKVMRVETEAGCKYSLNLELIESDEEEKKGYGRRRKHQRR